MSPLLILCNVLSVNVVWQGLAVDSQKLEVGTLILNWSDVGLGDISHAICMRISSVKPVS